MPRLRRDRLAAAALALVAAVAVRALEPKEWAHRQDLAVAQPGVIRLALPEATFDAAAPTLADLRLLDPQGREVAYLLDRPAAPAAGLQAAARFSSRLDGAATVLTVATGEPGPLEALLLETRAPFFQLAARIESSADGVAWTAVDAGVPVFRQWGAEQLALPLGGRRAAHLRVTLTAPRGPVPAFTAARLAVAAGDAPANRPAGARITAREEFAGETVLTVALDARHVPLARLELVTDEPLFQRRVSVGVREVRGDATDERVLTAGTLYRVAVDGAPARAQLGLPLAVSPETRELFVHIHNGDAPPLAVTGVRLERRPVDLVFRATVAGTYRLLSGNPQAAAPRYDLAAFADELRRAVAATAEAGPVVNQPDYAPRATLAGPPLPEIPLSGARLDASPWPRRKPVAIAAAGVQELELDPAALAGARADGADLRLLRAGNQIPFVLERPGLARSLPLTPEIADDPKRPATSVWTLRLPHAGLPLRQIALTVTTPLFDREFRLYEKATDTSGRPAEHTLARLRWNRTPEPGQLGTRVLALTDRPRGDVLYLETDNGDNPPVVLGPVRADYPVVRLVFKVADPAPVELLYGRADATAPRYDLALVAGRLLTAPRAKAVLGAESVRAANWYKAALAGTRGGPVFWGALALVVVVLLVVVAKLLPKPPAAGGA